MEIPCLINNQEQTSNFFELTLFLINLSNDLTWTHDSMIFHRYDHPGFINAYPPPALGRFFLLNMGPVGSMGFRKKKNHFGRNGLSLGATCILVSGRVFPLQTSGCFLFHPILIGRFRVVFCASFPLGFILLPISPSACIFASWPMGFLKSTWISLPQIRSASPEQLFFREICSKGKF